MAAAVSSSSALPASKSSRMARMRRGRQFEAAGLRERRHQGAHRRGVAARRLEDQALEIRRHLDVHRRRGGRAHVAQFVGAGRERACQDVVDIGGDAQAPDRQAHALGDIAGEDVAEISGRHGEVDAARRRAERNRAGEVIDGLRDDARPVDRIDAGQRDASRKA